MFTKEILLTVSKPARYINQELNSIHKKHNESTLKFCLVYPDIYEVGMSNVGFKIIYDVINGLDNILCERAFLPWADMENMIIEKSLVLSSLESGTPLKEFDCLGISLQTELNYTGLLNMLNLSKIPLLSAERASGYPLIIAGGPCCFNPEPLADFVDLFVIGEAEETIVKIASFIKKNKQRSNSKIPKNELLINLASIEGVYIPELYDVEYSHNGCVKNIYPKVSSAPKRIKKQIVADLNLAPYPEKTIVPYIEIIHDRIGIEIMRGCPNRCKFCQARNIYAPKRERSLETIKDLAIKNIDSTGYEELALLSLSSLDHSQILDIFSSLSQMTKGESVSISLPSLRAKSTIKDIIGMFGGMRRSGLTFAPEAGSQRLRKLINKNIDTDILYEVIEEAFKLGWRNIKLYFMIGLPGEADEDIRAITEMAYKIIGIKKKATTNNIGNIRMSFNSFIPKPHTAFQWVAAEKEHVLLQKEIYLKDKLKNKSIRCSFNDRGMALVEALLARGDRRLARLILKVWQGGAKLDAWRDQFNFNLWRKVIAEERIDTDFYLYRERDLDEIFPWEHIDIGIDKSSLVEEYQEFRESLLVDKA